MPPAGGSRVASWPARGRCEQRRSPERTGLPSCCPPFGRRGRPDGCDTSTVTDVTARSAIRESADGEAPSCGNVVRARAPRPPRRRRVPWPDRLGGPPTSSVERASTVPERPMNGRVDLELVASARGDTAAFEPLYDLCSSGVYGLIRRILRDRFQSDEVMQEVMLEVWRLAPRFDPQRGTASAWIMTIAHRRAVDRIRSEVAEQGRLERRRAPGAHRRCRLGPRRRHRRPRPPAGALGTGRAHRHPAVIHRTGLLRWPDPDRDRGAARRAARYGEDAHPRWPHPPSRRARRRIMSEPSEDLHTLVGLYVVDALDGEERQPVRGAPHRLRRLLGRGGGVPRHDRPAQQPHGREPASGAAVARSWSGSPAPARCRPSMRPTSWPPGVPGAPAGYVAPLLAAAARHRRLGARVRLASAHTRPSTASRPSPQCSPPPTPPPSSRR